MRLSFGDIMDSIDGTIGYIIRIFSEGLTKRTREAELYTLPGIFCRPNDADEDTVGTEDCVVIENGDDRIIIATKNAKAWASLISYLGRDLDKGETVISSDLAGWDATVNDTPRCHTSWRPDGTLRIASTNGDIAPNDKTTEIILDPATGNIDIDTAGTTPGLIRLGGAGATYIVAREDVLDTWWTTALTGVKAIIDNHGHQYLPGPGPLAITNGPTVALGPSAAPTPVPAWPAADSATVRCD
jgi:hypothetical protein